ncbi:hypothetical protein LA76x_0624 [Lysobacter antibioticus]|uniref:DUF2867 domain-containing protein n=1 Tax=Lysobacter antibioticus TaxID=84531 RepID=A0A0S2F5N6_LYSAN|nr:hypothetical protein LA76x_0624 [Lysobacter antibioticus]
MSLGQVQAAAVSLPDDSRLRNVFSTTDLVDAFALELPEGASCDAGVLARFVFERLPPWMLKLMRLRDALVGVFGLKTVKRLDDELARGQHPRIAVFKVYEESGREVVFGENDKHLDVRFSVLCGEDRTSRGGRRLVLATAVQCHNRLGRFYLACIAPFHRLIVRSCLASAARRGWPRAQPLESASAA